MERNESMCYRILSSTLSQLEKSEYSSIHPVEQLNLLETCRLLITDIRMYRDSAKYAAMGISGRTKSKENVNKIILAPDAKKKRKSSTQNKKEVPSLNSLKMNSVQSEIIGQEPVSASNSTPSKKIAKVVPLSVVSSSSSFRRLQEGVVQSSNGEWILCYILGTKDAGCIVRLEDVADGAKMEVRKENVIFLQRKKKKLLTGMRILALYPQQEVTTFYPALACQDFTGKEGDVRVKFDGEPFEQVVNRHYIIIT
jgi:hypothetical protein